MSRNYWIKTIILGVLYVGMTTGLYWSLMTDHWLVAIALMVALPIVRQECNYLASLRGEIDES